MRPLFYCILYFYPCSCLFCHFILRFCAILLLFLAVLTLKTLSHAPFLFKLYFLYLSNENVIIKLENKFPCYRILTFLRHYILPFITLLAFSVTASEIIVLFFAKPIDVYYMLCYNNFIRSIRCECMGVSRKYLLSLYRCKCLKYHKILYDVKLIKSLQITRR